MSEDLQKLFFSKQQNGEGLVKICRDLNGFFNYGTIKRWCKMIAERGCIDLSKSTGHGHTAPTKAAIRKVKSRVMRKKPLSARKIALVCEISDRTVRRTLRDDVHLKPHKENVAPLITDAHRTN